MKFELFIGFRYFIAKKSNQFLSRISIISVVTVCLALMVPTIVLSVINGFHDSVLNKIVGSSFHLQIKHKYDNFENYREIQKEIQKYPEIKFVTPFWQAQGLIKHYEDVRGVVVKAVDIDEMKKNTYFHENYKIVEGGSYTKPTFKEIVIPEDDMILAGEALARQLNLFKGETVEIVIPSSDADITQGSRKALRYGGKFSAGYAEYDKSLVLMRFAKARDIFGFADIATGLGVIVNDIDVINNVIDKLKGKYKNIIFENTVENSIYKDFLKEKQLMQFLLYFLVLAAFMTIYITIHVVVMEKRKEIGVLKSFGTTNESIVTIFLMQGLIIGMIGCLLGTIIGLLITVSLTEIVHIIEYLVNLFITLMRDVFDWRVIPAEKYEIMPSDVFYLQTFPYKLKYTDILLQGFGAILISLIASLLPALRAVKEKPSSVLRYE